MSHHTHKHTHTHTHVMRRIGGSSLREIQTVQSTEESVEVGYSDSGAITVTPPTTDRIFALAREVDWITKKNREGEVSQIGNKPTVCSGMLRSLLCGDVLKIVSWMDVDVKHGCGWVARDVSSSAPQHVFVESRKVRMYKFDSKSARGTRNSSPFCSTVRGFNEPQLGTNKLKLTLTTIQNEPLFCAKISVKVRVAERWHILDSDINIFTWISLNALIEMTQNWTEEKNRTTEENSR